MNGLRRKKRQEVIYENIWVTISFQIIFVTITLPKTQASIFFPQCTLEEK